MRQTQTIPILYYTILYYTILYYPILLTPRWGSGPNFPQTSTKNNNDNNNNNNNDDNSSHPGKLLVRMGPIVVAL